MIGIVYWEDPRAGSPVGRLIRGLLKAWSSLRGRMPYPDSSRSPTEGDAPREESSGHSWIPEPDRPPLRLIRLEAAAGPARHLCTSDPGVRSRAESHRGATAHVVFENGRWLARHPDGEIEITHCPYCGRRLPGEVPDPNQLRLELRG